VREVDGHWGVAERYAYDPYGNVTVLDGGKKEIEPDTWVYFDADGEVTEWDEDTGGSDWANTILFAGYHRDSETGLYHVRNRMYHTTLGLWLQRDPEGYVDGMSLYEYVGGGPVSALDPMGLFGLEEAKGYARRFAPPPVRVAIDTYTVCRPTMGPVKAMALAVTMEAASILPTNRYVAVFTGKNPEAIMAAAAEGTPLPPDLDAWDRVGHGFIGAGQHLGLVVLVHMTVDAAWGQAPEQPVEQPASEPTEPYDRQKHYGRTPTQEDREAVGAGDGKVADHDPPLVKRYYEGDPAVGEKPGHEMTQEERRESADDTSRMKPQRIEESRRQGGNMSQYSRRKKKDHGL
jgi:RHS repeat-associated protein